MPESRYVIVAGDFTTWGGMDHANYELAWYLAEHQEAEVHLVSHFVAAPLADHRNVTWHRVPKPLNSYMLGDPMLAWRGRSTARALARYGACVVVNGGNCAWPGANWVHAVHAAWSTCHADAPAMFRARAAWLKRRARRRERGALGIASVVITNSHAARRQVMDHYGLPAERVHAVYYGIDAQRFHPATPEERAQARRRLGFDDNRPLVAFIGPLGYDRNKGFDILFNAWKSLYSEPDWDTDLVAVGGGAEVESWRNRAISVGLSQHIRLTGFSRQISDVLAASDALVSPTHYDAYGLGVHEALCCGLPAFVTRSAGVAERYPANLGDLLLNDPPDAADIAQHLQRWRNDMQGYSARVAAFSETLRQRSWADMAREIIDLLKTEACT